MSEIYKCKNVGCEEEFAYRSQRSRHKKTCELPLPDSIFEEVDSGFRCKKCNIVISKKSNFSRHKKNVSLKKTKKRCLYNVLNLDVKGHFSICQS